MGRQFVWGWALSLGLLGAGQSAVRNTRDGEGERGPVCSEDSREDPPEREARAADAPDGEPA
jgi:hypothetical protein